MAEKDEGADPTPDLTIVGGQPRDNARRRRAWRVPVPNGMALVLHRASHDAEFCAALRRDRAGTLERSGVTLTASERATLLATPDAVLDAMAASLARSEWRQSRLMRMVAAAATSLAAGTLGADCKTDAPEDAMVDVRINVDAAVVDVNYNDSAGVDALTPPDVPEDALVDVQINADAGVDAGRPDAAPPDAAPPDATPPDATPDAGADGDGG